MSYWSPEGPSGEQILVIDDNIAELKILLELLRGKGYRLSFAMDAVQGYRRATTQQFDLILLGANEGSSDGFTACRLLKADPATAGIPAIFVSSGALPEERLMGLQLGAVDYITKPFNSDEVVARVEIHLALANRQALPHQDAGSTPEQLQTASELAQAPKTLSADYDLILLRAAQKLVLADLAEVPTLPELASQLGTNEKRLTRVFQTHTGNTVYKFIRAARLHEAKRMLASSAMYIEEVAAAIGFSSAANFSSAFRSYFGSPPSASRGSGAHQKWPDTPELT